jgi:hypothetical protein
MKHPSKFLCRYLGGVRQIEAVNLPKEKNLFEGTVTPLYIAIVRGLHKLCSFGGI